MANPMYGQNKADSEVSQSAQRTVPSLTGTDLANDTASITLALDTFYREVVTGVNKPLVLPAISASEDVYSMASTISGHAQTDCGPAAATNSILTLTGAATNCGMAVGSTIMLEVVESNKWCCVINSVHTGAGSDFAAYS